MKITRQQLKQIIKEELERVLNEDMLSRQNQRAVKTLVAQAARIAAKSSGHTGSFASWRPSSATDAERLRIALEKIRGVQMAPVDFRDATTVIRFTKEAEDVVPGSYSIRFGSQEADIDTGLSIINVEN